MPQGDWFILVIVGVVFIVLGIIGIIWGIREEKRLFERLAAQHDLREFSLRHVESPQPGALKLGGWIAIALGVLMVAVGIIFWYTGWPLD
jgi:protein-S-isoprenylcysteine O-methyltransferase Ste14